MDTIDTNKSIIPIVVASKDDLVQEILGTGSFVGTSETLYILTAKHIFYDVSLDQDSRFAFVLKTEKRVEFWGINKITATADYDIAICEIPDIENAVPLPFSTQQPASNSDVLCYEYSQTSIVKKPDGGKHVTFDAFTHKGNIMRYFDSEFPEKVKTNCFNTSFPALQGASGAPIIANTKNKSFYIAGMVVANEETHLQPAQIVKVVDGYDQIEEISYFLPKGKAINASLITRTIQGLGIKIEFVE